MNENPLKSRAIIFSMFRNALSNILYMNEPLLLIFFIQEEQKPVDYFNIFYGQRCINS